MGERQLQLLQQGFIFTLQPHQEDGVRQIIPFGDIGRAWGFPPAPCLPNLVRRGIVGRVVIPKQLALLVHPHGKA